MQVYLGNLAPEVDEPLLYELMSQLAPVAHVRMPKHKIRRTRQGYGFAVFHSSQDARYVLDLLNAAPLKLYGRPLRVSSAAHADPASAAPAAPAVPRIFVGNLPPTADEQSLRRPFERFGRVHDVEIVAHPPKCHAFVRLDGLEAAERAAKELNGQYILDRKIRVDFER